MAGYSGDYTGRSFHAESRTMASRMRSIACDGLSFFGQTSVQFMMLRQRYRR